MANPATKDKPQDTPAPAETTAVVAQDAAPAETDLRRKVSHEEVIKLKGEGIKPTEIATRLGVAVGTVYKILREGGAGSGRTITRGSKGVNVSAEVTALIDRLQTTVDSADADKASELERHEAALASIDAESIKARTALTALGELRTAVTDPEDEEVAANENGTPAPEGEQPTA